MNKECGCGRKTETNLGEKHFCCKSIYCDCKGSDLKEYYCNKCYKEIFEEKE